MKWNVRLIIVSTLVATLLPSCATAPPRRAEVTPARFQAGSCVFEVPEGVIEGDVEGAELVCGTVEVPERHANPGGPQIQLSVTIVKSTSAAPAPDPLLMFTGGPGGNIFAMVPQMLSGVGSVIRADRDIVLVSERGTFGAEPFLGCPELGQALEPNFGVDQAVINTLTLEALTACHERLVNTGIDLDDYSDRERAADMPAVMRALGFEQYNLWGVSGGGLLTQVILRDYPTGVRSLMIDSGAFPMGQDSPGKRSAITANPRKS